jgi:hypothetical protein
VHARLDGLGATENAVLSPGYTGDRLSDYLRVAVTHGRIKAWGYDSFGGAYVTRARRG